METIVTITGPSCSGKSTLAQFLSTHGIPEVQSFTTRKPRKGEPVGYNAPYRFVDRAWVGALLPEDVIEQVEFNGNYYGNTIDQLRNAWRNGNGIATVVVEPKGVQHWSDAAAQRGFRHVALYLSQSKETLLSRFAERLKSAPVDRIDYEVQRLQSMLDVEFPTWGEAFNYDLTVHGLGTKSSLSGVTMEMIYGWIKLGLAN